MISHALYSFQLKWQYLSQLNGLMHISNSDFGEGNFLKLDAYETELGIPSSPYFVKASTCNCYEYKWKTHGAQTGDRGLGGISYYAMNAIDCARLQTVCMYSRNYNIKYCKTVDACFTSIHAFATTRLEWDGSHRKSKYVHVTALLFIVSRKIIL